MHDISYIREFPTEFDNIYRNKLIHGEVHDENAHLLGGVAGHAGLFSTAKDIGKYSKMMLDHGLWAGRRLFKSDDIVNFTQRHNLPIDSERTLGWDTPSRNGKSSAGDYFSESSYGHLGFTGTSIWIDPDNQVIVVLLSNRVHPSRMRGGIYGIRRDFHMAILSELLK